MWLLNERDKYNQVFLGNERDLPFGWEKRKRKRKNCHLLIWSFGWVKVGNYELSDIFCLVLDHGPPICTNKFDFRCKDHRSYSPSLKNKQQTKKEEKDMACAPLLYKQAKTTVSWPQVYHWVVRKCHCSLCQNESQVIGTLATLQPSPCQNESFGVRTFQ